MENANVDKKLQVFGSKIFILLALAGLIFPMVSASGENISFSYPPSVDYGEEWSASVELMGFSENLWDVKIDVWNSTTRISEMDNNGDWKSTNYYFIGAINNSVTNSSSFDLNISKIYEGDAVINVSIRKNGGSTVYKFGPYPLTVDYVVPEVHEEPVEESVVENETVEETANESSVAETIVPGATPETEEVMPETIETSKPVDYNSESPPVFSMSKENEEAKVTGEVIVNPKDEKIKNVSIYLFTGTLILGALYLAKLRFWS